jgi:hypothetical protein
MELKGCTDVGLQVLEAAGVYPDAVAVVCLPLGCVQIQEWRLQIVDEVAAT